MAVTSDNVIVPLLAAFNATDPTVLKAFLTQRGLTVDAVTAWATFQRSVGPLKLVREDITDGRTVALARDRCDRCFNLIPTREPFRIDVAAAWIPDNALPARMDWAELKDALQEKLDDHAARDQFSGALIVSQNAQPLFQAVYGLADREQQQPNTLETRFRVGSMNKMLTGVAVLQLAQDRALGLDDTVGTHLPDYPNRAFADRVTIRHLLNHTGGAGDFFGPLFDAHRSELRDPADYVRIYRDREPEFEPGTRHKYANYGFIVLGRLIEAASGQPYDDFVKTRILSVAGMNSTGALPESTSVPGRSVGYMDSPSGPIRNDATLPFRGTPAGGGYSTVGDLVRFAEGLTSGTLLNEENIRLIGVGDVDMAPGVRYGAGFMQFTRSGARWFGHSGGAPGMNGTLSIFPDTGFIVAVLANGDPPQADSVGDFIAQRLPAQ